MSEKKLPKEIVYADPGRASTAYRPFRSFIGGHSNVNFGPFRSKDSKPGGFDKDSFVDLTGIKMKFVEGPSPEGEKLPEGASEEEQQCWQLKKFIENAKMGVMYKPKRGTFHIPPSPVLEPIFKRGSGELPPVPDAKGLPVEPDDFSQVTKFLASMVSEAPVMEKRKLQETNLVAEVAATGIELVRKQPGMSWASLTRVRKARRLFENIMSEKEHWPLWTYKWNDSQASGLWKAIRANKITVKQFNTLHQTNWKMEVGLRCQAVVRYKSMNKPLVKRKSRELDINITAHERHWRITNGLNKQLRKKRLIITMKGEEDSARSIKGWNKEKQDGIAAPLAATYKMRNAYIARVQNSRREAWKRRKRKDLIP